MSFTWAVIHFFVRRGARIISTAFMRMFASDSLAMASASERDFSGKQDVMRSSVRALWKPHVTAAEARSRAQAHARRYGTAFTAAHAVRSAAYSSR